MSIDSWIIIIDERRVGGMLAATRNLGGQVTAAVAGSRTLADTVASMGFDRVLCFETTEDLPAEAIASQVAEVIAKAAPRLVLGSDMPASRVLLGAAANKLNAAVLGSVRELTRDGEFIVASCSEAEDRLLEDFEVAGALIGIFDGDDAEASAEQTVEVAVELIPPDDSAAPMQLAEILDPDESAGLLTATRVVSAGVGVKSKDDLKIVEELAAAMHAEIGCSLPVCDDMRWMPTNRVVGSTHNQIAPELYMAVGISGQPQHLAGVRDAKIVVAINNDPEARIFKNCNYGILGDLYKIVPVLTAAFQKIE